MGTLARPSPITRFPWRPAVVVALVAMTLVAVGLIVSVGSRPAIPTPFGPAGNGALLYRDADGTIRTLDPETGRVASIAAPLARPGDPVPSRDGRRVAFLPADLGAGRIVVSDPDGTNAVTLAGDYHDVSQIDWSPDSGSLAIVSGVRGIPSISILPADGAAARTFTLGREVDQLWYLPDGRLALLASREPGKACNLDTPFHIRSCDLFTMRTDGTGLEPVLSAPRFDGIKIHPSPDGTKLLYVFWAENAEGRLHVVDIASGEDDQLSVRGVGGAYSINRAWFSPDGSAILFDLFESGGEHWAIVPSEGGQVREIGPAWPPAPEGSFTNATWSPDGRSVLAHYPVADGPDQLWILDATGAGDDRRLDVDVPALPEWQRTAD